jgi:hypothetical protein
MSKDNIFFQSDSSALTPIAVANRIIHITTAITNHTVNTIPFAIAIANHTVNTIPFAMAVANCTVHTIPFAMPIANHM